jgi:CelD/BcsL family acetyltransferase involved in cellulose biosynthesis
MNIAQIDPGADPRWASLVSQHESNLFHCPPWIRALQQTYGLPIRAYVAQDGAGEPQAGMSFCRVEDILDPRVASMPFSDYCDPLVYDQATWNQFVERLLAQRCPVTVRCLYNDLPLSDARFSLYSRAKWHGVDLQPDEDTLWQRVDESSRRAIRKARSSGIVVRPAESKDELRRFFELHLRIRKYKYRLLAQPYSLFENLWEQFVEQQNGFLMVAAHEGTIIGGVYFLGWKDTIYYKFNASDTTNLSYRPNDLVVWESMRYAKERGYKLLDFGLSDWDQEGLLRYKRKFATDERTISFLRYTPDSAPSAQTSALRGLLPQLTDLLTDPGVPDEVTERGGDALYKYFT